MDKSELMSSNYTSMKAPKNFDTPHKLPINLQESFSVHEFIGFCRDYRVETSIEELAQLEFDRKLLPSFKIKRQIMKMQEKGSILHKNNNLDDNKNILYMYQELGALTNDKFKILQDNNQVIFPSDKKFTTYRTLFAKITKNRNELAFPHLSYYSKTYFFHLYHLLHPHSIKSSMIKTPGGWVKLQVKNFNTIADFLQEVFILWEKKEVIRHLHLKEPLEMEKEGEGRLSASDKNHADIEASNECKREAESIINKYSFTTDYLRQLKLYFIGFGTFGFIHTSNRLNKPYLLKITDELLYQCEYPYKIATIINWLIFIHSAKKETLMELWLGNSSYSTCPYCLTSYVKRRVDQTNCASTPCQRLHSNNLKRKGRKEGKYT